MSERKAFYEIEKPPKKTYTVVVMEAPAEDAPLCCQYMESIFNKAGEVIGQLVCDCDTMSNDVFECPCCGRNICDDHLNQTTINGEYYCLTCAKLPKEDIERISALRLELNR